MEEQWWASELTGGTRSTSLAEDGKWRFPSGHRSLGVGEKMGEENFNSTPELQFIDHRPLSYHFSATFSTYFGDRVPFVLCSIWVDLARTQFLQRKEFFL